MSSMPVLLWLAIIGADPDHVLSESGPCDGTVFGCKLVSKSNPLRPNSSRNAAQTPFSAFGGLSSVVRAQSLDGSEFSSDQLSGGGWNIFDRETIDHFIAEMNPLATVPLRFLDGYYDPFGWQASYGTNGHQPWRLGWVTYNDLTIIPYAPITSGTTGNMQIVEWNSNVRISELIAPGVLFNGTGYFNAQWWNGPSGIPLPGQVDQISADLELGFFNGGPWSGQIAFHPQIVDSYDSRLNKYAFNFDGRIVATYKASPSWSFVAGVGFWDRVYVLVIPHVGVIWAPDDRWEVRALFPKSRISYYLGRWNTTDYWAYGTYEYMAESWEVDIGTPTVYVDRMQITEQQLALGLRWDSGRYSFFVEGGFVFDRQAKFLGPTPNFNIGDVGMIRVGARY